MTAIQRIGLDQQPVSWGNDGELYSDLFGDCFYPQGDGLAISRHTFLIPNNIPERCKAQHSLRIGEIGFGTGLNLFATLQEWCHHARVGRTLHFVTFERYLLPSDTIRQALSRWPELHSYVSLFCDRIPPAVHGVFRVPLPEFQAFVTLFLGDARELIEECAGTMDAWYLDGFAPSRNPELWNECIYKGISRMSAAGTTLASFSAAGHVRRALHQVGYDVQRIPGYGTKRDHIRADYSGTAPLQKRRLPERIGVIGGGIAGAALAFSLRMRGKSVHLFEKADSLAQGGSGNPQGIFLPYLSAYGGAPHNLYLGGFCYSQALYTLLEQRSPSFLFHKTGVVQTYHDRRVTTLADHENALCCPRELLQFACAEELSQISGIPFSADGIHYPSGGHLSPPAAITTLLSNAQDEVFVHLCHDAVKLEQRSDGCRVYCTHETEPFELDAVIVAGAHESADLNPLTWLPLEPLKGQIVLLRATSLSQQLKTPICGDGYISPAVNGVHVVGSTFVRGSKTLFEDLQASEQLCKKGLAWSPAIEFSTENKVGYRCGLRASTPDRLPIVGPALSGISKSYTQLLEEFQSDRVAEHDFQEMRNLYISAGFGSRGLVSAPLAAEIVASSLCDEPAPCARSTAKALLPSRFIERAQRKARWG